MAVYVDFRTDPYPERWDDATWAAYFAADDAGEAVPLPEPDHRDACTYCDTLARQRAKRDMET